MLFNFGKQTNPPPLGFFVVVTLNSSYLRSGGGLYGYNVMCVCVGGGDLFGYNKTIIGVRGFPI